MRQPRTNHQGRRLLTIVSLAASGGALGAVHRSNADFRAEYTVAVKDTLGHLLHVTATFSNVQQPQLSLALPTWIPGHYEIENYAKNVLRFAVTDERGAPIHSQLSAPQTWTIDTRNKHTVVAEFDYRANLHGADQAMVSGSYAFFTGVQLFLEPVGHRDAPSLVRLRLPDGWRAVSALRETDDSAVFTAPDYDALVDAPTWMGAFDLHRYEVEGKPLLLAVEPPGRLPSFSPESIKVAISRVSAVIRAEDAIFGGLPYEKYVVFRIPGPADPAAIKTIEHATSFVTVNTRDLGDVVDSHEFFHLWNVKRIRPAEMWPYDYSRPNVTPSLWFSEGVTQYYSDLSRYRAGSLSEGEFLERVAGLIDVNPIDRPGRPVSNGPGRFVSPSDASEATWLGRSYWSYWSYYGQGEMLGALLDVSILHDRHGARRLDDVMRVLYHDFYERNRGFTATDLVRTVGEVAGRDYSMFFDRFVTGVDVLPFDTLFGYAGLRLKPRYAGTIAAPQTVVDQGRRIDGVVAGGPAMNAGLRKGDVIQTVDGNPVDRYVPYCCKIVDGDGERAILGILRDSTHLTIPIALRRGPQVGVRLESVAEPTPEQLAVQRAWLARSQRQ